MKRVILLSWCLLSLTGCSLLAGSSESKDKDTKERKEPKEQPASIPIVDLNTASVRQLMALPGIGHTYAKHIVEGRPYTAPRELLERKIVPPHVWEKCKDHVSVVAP